MLNINFSEKSLGLVFPTHFVYNLEEVGFTCYLLLTDQISLPDCLYFSRYWAIYVLQLFAIQAVTL